MSHLVSLNVLLKTDDANKSKNHSKLPSSKNKSLPPLPPSSPASLALLAPSGAAKALSRSATVPSAQLGASESTKSRTLSSNHLPVYPIKLLPLETKQEKSVAPSPPKAVESTTRRIVRRQLGGGSTDLTQRPQLSEPAFMVRLPRRSEPTTKSRNPLVLSAPGTGDSEDDESTLVSCSDAHVCQAGYNAKGVLFKDTGPNQPVDMMHRKILNHVPGFSDDDNDDGHDGNHVAGGSSRRRPSCAARTPTPPSRCWGLRGTTQVDFEVLQEERAIPTNTALRPPPWHHPPPGP